MRQILDSYFERMDQEAFEWLQVAVWLPILLIVFVLEAISNRTKALREWAGRKLLIVALCAFSRRSLLREYVGALLLEQRSYERYEGWCELTRTGPLSFEDWRREQARVVWLQRKMRASE